MRCSQPCFYEHGKSCYLEMNEMQTYSIFNYHLIMKYLMSLVSNVDIICVLLDVLVCSIAVYVYELF